MNAHGALVNLNKFWGEAGPRVGPWEEALMILSTFLRRRGKGKKVNEHAYATGV